MRQEFLNIIFGEYITLRNIGLKNCMETWLFEIIQRSWAMVYIYSGNSFCLAFSYLQHFGDDGKQFMKTSGYQGRAEWVENTFTDAVVIDRPDCRNTSDRQAQIIPGWRVPFVDPVGCLAKAES